MKSPVSFNVSVARLPQKGLPVRIEADARQRQALAREHGLLEIQEFTAELLVTSWKRNGVRVAGQVKAEIEQECVVTLDPVHDSIAEEFSQVYLPDDSKLGRQGFHEGGEILLDADGPDSPETFTGDSIDAGALAEEFFALAINPYPRKSGASVEAAADADAPVEGKLQEKLSSLIRKT
jgi:hypothetical protein